MCRICSEGDASAEADDVVKKIGWLLRRDHKDSLLRLPHCLTVLLVVDTAACSGT